MEQPFSAVNQVPEPYSLETLLSEEALVSPEQAVGERFSQVIDQAFAEFGEAAYLTKHDLSENLPMTMPCSDPEANCFYKITLQRSGNKHYLETDPNQNFSKKVNIQEVVNQLGGRGLHYILRGDGILERYNITYRQVDGQAPEFIKNNHAIVNDFKEIDDLEQVIDTADIDWPN